MALTPFQRSTLGSMVEQWIRRDDGWDNANAAEYNRRLRERFPQIAEVEPSRTTRALVDATIRNARDAATMQANPTFTLPNLGRTTWMTNNTDRYVYRYVVAAKHIDGSEITSTAVTVTSATPLNHSEARALAIEQAIDQMNFTIGRYPNDRTSSALVTWTAWAVSAGTTR